MNNFKSPEISDETKIIVNDLWEKYTNIVVLGPAGSYPYDIRFRIYAYGGRIAGIPFNKNNDWLLLPDEKYKNYNDAGLKKYFDKKSELINDKSELNNYIIELLQENTDNIIDEVIKAAEEKFSTEEKNPKERAIQTKLVRKYLSKYVESGYIICDMEFCVPQSENTIGNKKSDFDLIIMDPKNGKLGIIELKCNSDACGNKTGKSADLKAHLADMIACLSDPKYVRDNIIYRYACLKKAGLISDALPKAEEINLDEVFCGFLFIDDGSKTLSTKKNVVVICEKCFEDDIKYLEEEENKIRFLYADSVDDVDFTQMQSWVDFKKS